MRAKRAQFKSAVRKFKEVGEQKESDRLTQKLLRGDSDNFWKEIKRINARNKPVSVAETVDGKSGTNDISAMWKDHFQKLLNLNSVPSSSKNLSLHDYHFERFTPTEIVDAISYLKNGKSSGVDQLFAEHVKNADKRVTVPLSLLFNACVIHGSLPVGHGNCYCPNY